MAETSGDPSTRRLVFYREIFRFLKAAVGEKIAHMIVDNILGLGAKPHDDGPPHFDYGYDDSPQYQAPSPRLGQPWLNAATRIERDPENNALTWSGPWAFRLDTPREFILEEMKAAGGTLPLVTYSIAALRLRLDLVLAEARAYGWDPDAKPLELPASEPAVQAKVQVKVEVEPPEEPVRFKTVVEPPEEPVRIKIEVDPAQYSLPFPPSDPSPQPSQKRNKPKKVQLLIQKWASDKYGKEWERMEASKLIAEAEKNPLFLSDLKMHKCKFPRNPSSWYRAQGRKP
jgi:hypothetical protein